MKKPKIKTHARVCQEKLFIKHVPFHFFFSFYFLRVFDIKLLTLRLYPLEINRDPRIEIRCTRVHVHLYCYRTEWKCIRLQMERVYDGQLDGLSTGGSSTCTYCLSAAKWHYYTATYVRVLASGFTRGKNDNCPGSRVSPSPARLFPSRRVTRRTRTALSRGPPSIVIRRIRLARVVPTAIDRFIARTVLDATSCNYDWNSASSRLGSTDRGRNRDVSKSAVSAHPDIDKE